MAGGWRISEADEFDALRRARRDARTLRTEAAWNRFAAQVARCERYGLLGDDVCDEPAALRPADPVGVRAPRVARGEDSGSEAGTAGYTAAAD